MGNSNSDKLCVDSFLFSFLVFVQPVHRVNESGLEPELGPRPALGPGPGLDKNSEPILEETYYNRNEKTVAHIFLLGEEVKRIKNNVGQKHMSDLSVRNIV